MKVDLRLNAIVDPERSGGRDLAELARLCAQGGATLVQLRDKHSETRAMVETARAIKKALAPFNVPPSSSTTASMSRSPPAPTACISGRTTWRSRMRGGFSARRDHRSVDQVASQRPRPRRSTLIDYVGSGGVYVTLSKQQKKPPIGPQGLARIIELLQARATQQMPVCGIAGIDASNAAEVIDAGADGVAVISALSLAPDPAAAAQTLRGIVDARWPNGAHDGHGDRRDHCRLGFRRRRRHPGRP